MPWLVRGEDVLASAEVAVTRKLRRRGLFGRDSLDGVLVLRPCRQVHTVGMKFPIAVAWVTRDHIIADVKIAKPGGLMYGTWRAASFILEAHTDHLSALSKGSRLDWTSIS